MRRFIRHGFAFCQGVLPIVKAAVEPHQRQGEQWHGNERVQQGGFALAVESGGLVGITVELHAVHFHFIQARAAVFHHGRFACMGVGEFAGVVQVGGAAQMQGLTAVGEGEVAGVAHMVAGAAEYESGESVLG